MFTWPQSASADGTLYRMQSLWRSEHLFAFFVSDGMAFQQREKFEAQNSFDAFELVRGIPPVSFLEVKSQLCDTYDGQNVYIARIPDCLLVFDHVFEQGIFYIT